MNVKKKNLIFKILAAHQGCICQNHREPMLIVETIGTNVLYNQLSSGYFWET